MNKKPRYIRWFNELSIDDVPLVGGKNASLGEMYRELGAVGVRVPNGFAITAEAYRDILTEADLWEPLTKLLSDIDKTKLEQLGKKAQQARELIYSATFPDDLRHQILDAYEQLEQEYSPELSVAV
ncbi:MAG: pyruvate,water dikinase, partial [Planctomycetota bacterium]